MTTPKNPPAGYSGRSLSEKLGLKAGMRAIAFNTPEEYPLWLEEEAQILKLRPRPPWDFIHLFVNSKRELEDYLLEFRTQINKNGMIWVSWYKKSAKKPTEITEDVIREAALPLGWVDVKVCAVSGDWSGLKLVIRKSLR